MLETDTVKFRLIQLTPFADTTGQKEQGFFIKDYQNQFGLGIVPLEIRTISPDGGNMTVKGSYVRAKVHTHPKGKIPAPSPTDFKSILDAWTDYRSFTDSYILAADSSKYALHVSDTTKMKAFRTTYGDFADSASNDFKVGNALRDKRDKIKDSFVENNGLSEEEALARALSAILEEAGITLLKADKGSNQFYKIGTKKRLNPNGSEAKDKNDRNKYTEADCQ